MIENTQMNQNGQGFEKICIDESTKNTRPGILLIRKFRVDGGENQLTRSFKRDVFSWEIESVALIRTSRTAERDWTRSSKIRQRLSACSLVHDEDSSDKRLDQSIRSNNRQSSDTTTDLFICNSNERSSSCRWIVLSRQLSTAMICVNYGQETPSNKVPCREGNEPRRPSVISPRDESTAMDVSSMENLVVGRTERESE